MLQKFFESLYHKVFVNIVVKNLTTDVYIEICSKKGTVQHHQDSFQTKTMNNKMLEFISSYTKESPYFYISILDNSKEQGAIPTCDRHRLSEYHDISTSELKCIHEKWSYYTSKTDLYEIEKNYQDIGIDMIFSPFTILTMFFKDKLAAGLAMYILIQKDSISLVVCKESQLLYGVHKDMYQDRESVDTLLSNELEDIDLALHESIDLEDLDVDDDIEDIDELDDLDDFADIEDLDAIEDIDEFSKTQDIEEELFEAEENVSESSNDNFNEDYERFNAIQQLLGAFYHDERFKSEFVENVYIADTVGVTGDLKRYLEEEMFLNVYIRQMDINRELAELAKMEIKL